MSGEEAKGGAPLAIIVMGVSGSGKSTLGNRLAVALGCPFLEGDHFHSPQAVAKMSAGVPLDDDDRWPWLDRLARGASRAIDDHGVAVVACSALRRAYRDRLRGAIGAPALFVMLDCSRDDLLLRLDRREGHYMPASLLDSQIATLEHPGEEADVLVLDGTAPAAALRDSVLQALAGPRRRAAAGG